ncbi:signal transducer CD24 isoform X1 [Symphalangus syndactylus]|uniref:signal transducer CD24 isoform X1 n=1 Tax=Symphalangus syndactylus TaxID=9590 RepID=UPI002440FD78|nr:signal transducer CD24 isoform X1 [Symphalangus syndactylus]
MVGRFCPESPPGFVRVAATSAVSPDPPSGEPRPGCGYRGPRSAALRVYGCTAPARETGGWAWETLAGAGGEEGMFIYSNETITGTTSSNPSQNTSNFGITPNPTNATTKAAGGALQSTASLFVVSLSLLHLYC